MKIYTTTLAILLAIFAMSCNSSSSHDSADHGEAIELNNGEKWKVNAEMTPYVLTAQSILSQYEGDDYKALAEQLAAQNKSLISSCTMDGKSHDELHKWLHPHLGLVKNLGNAKDKAEADLIIEDLKKSFETFNTYFQ